MAVARRSSAARRGRRKAPTAFFVAASALLVLRRCEGRYLLADSGDFFKGCIFLTPGDHTYSMSSTTACAGRRCPPCFVFDTDLGNVNLRVQACHQNQFAGLHSVSVLTSFQFTNVGGQAATVEDDASNRYMIPRQGMRGSSIECNCFGAIGLGYLACDASVTPVLNLAAYNSMSNGDSCATVTGTLSLDLSDNDCGIHYCPHCFRLNTDAGVVTLSTSNCRYYQGYDTGTEGAVLTYQFVNTGTNLGYVNDGTYEYTLQPYGSGQAHMDCVCFGGNNQLSCDNPTVKAVGGGTAVALFPEHIRVGGNIQLESTGTTYVRYDASTSRIEMYAGSTRTFSAGAGVGTLHGLWTSDNLMTTSDKRLKREIRPLREALREAQLASGRQVAADELGDPAQWLLEQLRPVSYHMIDKAAGPNLRFGFLADDLEKVLPNTVAAADDERRTKRIHLTDLISVLTAVIQGHQAQITELRSASDANAAWREVVEARLAKVEQATARRCDKEEEGGGSRGAREE